MIIYGYKRNRKQLSFEGKDGEIHTIGNKLFPLSKKKDIACWWEGNTEKVKRHEQLVELLDNVSNYEFKIGRCYKNAQAVYLIGKRFNLNIKYYSGWIFPYQSMPLHHSWNVLNNNIIIDTSIDSSYIKANELMFEKKEELQEKDGDEIRKYYVEIIANEMRANKHKKISDSCIWGKVPQGYAYFGTEDTYEGATERFNELLLKVENHPSYPHRRSVVDGASPTQELLREKGLW